MSKTFFGQPRQLSTLFHIELWERFSFYGMNSILAMYLYHSVTKGGLGFSEAVGGSIATAYGGSVYLSSIFGGWVADRILGAERTLFYSGVLVMLGHIALALIPGVSGMIAGLVCIALGSGGVKASASTMVGSLYENEEWRARRDPDSPFSTSPSTSAGCSARSSPGYCKKTSASTMASASPPSAWHLGCGATITAAKSCQN